jgi:DNA-binding beta-propeller fold protein YncE
MLHTAASGFGPRSTIKPVTRTLISRRDLLVSSAALAACGSPKATTFPGYCFVANQESRSVAVVDLRRFRVRKQIALDAAPSLVLPHPSVPKVFVLAPNAGTVYEVEAATLSVSRRVRAGNQAIAMQVSPRKNALWVLYRDPAALVEIPLDSFRPGRRIRLESPPDAFDLTGAGSEQHRAAIASARDRNIEIVSLDSATVERTVSTAQDPSIVSFRMDGKQLIAGSRADRSLSIFDVSSGQTIVRLPLAVEPRTFCVSPDGGQLFVSGEGMDAVVIVFPYSTEIWQTVLAGRAPGAMAVTNAPSFLLVANPDTDSLTVLDFSTQKLVALVQVGQRPGQILLTPDADQQYALVLNEGSGDLAVIRTYSLRAPQLSAKARFKSAPVFTMIPVGERPVSAAVVTLT